MAVGDGRTCSNGTARDNFLRAAPRRLLTFVSGGRKEPATERWTQAALSVARSSHAANRLEDGSVIVTGGEGCEGTPLGSVERLDGEAFHVAGEMATARARHDLISTLSCRRARSRAPEGERRTRPNGLRCPTARVASALRHLATPWYLCARGARSPGARWRLPRRLGCPRPGPRAR